MSKLFSQVDGADISADMIQHARQRTPGSQFWVTSGADAGDAPTGAYDFVYCTISLQHICVFTVRDRITRDLKRILKPDGKMTLQYLYSNRYPLVPVDQPMERDGAWVQTWRPDTRHARWEDDKTAARSTNSSCDVVIGQDEIPKVRAYFQRYFEEVEFWFWDISIARQEPKSANWEDTDLLSRYHPNSVLDTRYWGTHYIFIHCAKPKP
jgi:SAM-dependent methyltransferase